MLKPSEIIQLAKDHPHYLRSQEHACNWLCGILHTLKREGVIDHQQMCDTRLHVEKSLQTGNGTIDGYDGYSSLYLRGHLIRNGIIPEDTLYSSPEYRSAAHAHWDELTAKLQAQGL